MIFYDNISYQYYNNWNPLFIKFIFHFTHNKNVRFNFTTKLFYPILMLEMPNVISFDKVLKFKNIFIIGFIEVSMVV